MAPEERRWLRAEMLGPSGLSGEDWASACAEALGPAGGLGVEERESRDGRPVALAWLPAACSRQRLEEAIGQADLPAEIASLSLVEDAGWVEAFNRTLRTIEVGRRLAIVPGDDAAAPGRAVVRLEPGRAFGTGHHESTRLALEWLEEILVPGARVLDVGTGSGILAAAAMVLGASGAVAIDVDPEAIEVAGETMRRTLGASASRVELVVAGSPSVVPGRHDVVMANIQADVIHAMLPALLARVAPRGCVILSGLLDVDIEGIDAALRADGLLPRWRREGEWASACASREEGLE